MSETNNIIPVQPTIDENGRRVYRCSMVPTGSGIVHQMQHSLIIPVIFVPGMMGSNLVDSKGSNLWNGDGPSGFSYKLIPWHQRGAVKRKETLDPSRTRLRESKNLKKDKGWEEPGTSFYLKSIKWFQNNLNDYDCYNQKSGERFQMQDGDEQNILSSEDLLNKDSFNASLKTDDVQHSYNFDFPVYACGYNWLDDNKNSAEFLLKRIQDVLNIEKQNGPTLGKVIIITHSMGGLVTRYCSEVSGGKDKILGVVHGVMPATGAAAAYARMKTGNPGGGIANAVMGATGADMSAVMSQAPGSLELLPFKEYGEGTEYKQWLRFSDNSAWVNDRLPEKDAFKEIYTSDEWYGLFEEPLVNPDGLKVKYRTEKVTFDSLLLKDVLPFQTLIADKYHLNSYVFYGKSDNYRAYGSITWNGKILPRFATLPQNGVDKVGGLQKQDGAEDYNYYKCYVMSDPDVDGDGTVPFVSGVAPKGKKGVKCIRFLETDHQKAYNVKESQLFTLWSIVQIVKQVICQ